jgi:hypothetical protein
LYFVISPDNFPLHRRLLEQAAALREGTANGTWESFNIAYDEVYGEPPLSVATPSTSMRPISRGRTRWCCS